MQMIQLCRMEKIKYRVVQVLLLLSLISLTNTACKKTTVTPEPTPTADLTKNVGSMNEMIVPNGFLYLNSRKVHVTVPMVGSEYGSAKQKVEIYDGNPLSNGNLINTGAAVYPNIYETDIFIPRGLDVIYVRVVHPDNSSTTEKVTATTNQVTVLSMKKNGNSLYKSAPASPDCNTGCTSTVTGNQNISLNNSASVVCITGTYSGSVDINRGTVRICGNATISNCNLNNDATLLIASGATVTINSLNVNGGTTTVRNWCSSLNIRSSFSPGGRIDNYGNIIVSGDFNINGSSSVTNDGTITIGGSLNNNKTLVNNGQIAVSGSFAQNGGGAFTNNCQLSIAGDANLNSSITNNEYISVTLTTTINSGSTLYMVDAAMLKTRNFVANNAVVATGSTSLIKVSNTTTINGGGNLSGTLQYCDQNGIETNWGTIAPSVSQGCNQYIPVSACNPDGNGVIVIPDTDKDGANDNIDEYPNDPNLAFNNYYPNGKELATAAFEDLWPSKGDYDMNDLVIDFRHNFITNANNEVVKYDGYYRLRASGGSQRIAFCMGLPVKADNHSDIEGAVQEKGHDNIVFTLFEDTKKELGGWNTVMSQPKVDFREYKVSFDLKEYVSLKEFGPITYFDPFIWVNEEKKGRGYEIHVPGNAPTALADKQWFGYADDATNPEKGNYYLSKNNLPWAFVVPENFDYCVELSMLGMKEPIDITQVYLHFAQWAQSNGEIYKDWYKDEKGYRNSEYLYTK